MVVVPAFAASASVSAGNDHSDRMANQIGRQRWEPIVVALCPAILNRHVLMLDIAGFVQPATERCQKGR